MNNIEIDKSSIQIYMSANDKHMICFRIDLPKTMDLAPVKNLLKEREVFFYYSSGKIFHATPFIFKLEKIYNYGESHILHFSGKDLLEIESKEEVIRLVNQFAADFIWEAKRFKNIELKKAKKIEKETKVLKRMNDWFKGDR